MTQLFPHLLNGLSLGLLFALIALGFMLIVGVMEVINLAHGSLFALGAYFAMTVIQPDAAWSALFVDWYVALPLGLRYGLALVVAPALVSVVGMCLEFCMRRTYGKKAEYGLLLTFGAALVLEGDHPACLGSFRTEFAGSGTDVRPGVVRRIDLFKIQAVRSTVFDNRDIFCLAVPGTYALWSHHQGRRS